MPEHASLALHVAAQPLPGAAVLGAFRVGVENEPPASPSVWPTQQVRMPVLAEQHAASHEWWQLPGGSGSSLQTETRVLGSAADGGTLCWRQSEGLLFGVAEVPSGPGPGSAGGRDLESASEGLYDAVLQLLSQHARPLHLWRVWNYIPAIHEEDAGLERYRRFNLGRARALKRFDQLNARAIPAACALGVANGPLSVAFLAGEQMPVPLENPRQISAYQYPKTYGPQPPSFARASLVTDGDQLWLFVSGTASIVGHESLHLGDVQAQLHESMDNIEVLLAQAAITGGHPGFTLEDMHYRVYLRSESDVALAREVLEQRLGQAPWLMCQAEVCRKELLVEIEAVGKLPLNNQ